jgi:heme exporter protein B
MKFFAQFRHIVAQGLKAEFAEKDRLISPLLFAATMLILFSFAVGEVSNEIVIKIHLAQTFLTMMLALQTSFSRIFDPDERDRVFELLQTYPLNHYAWFLGKYFLVLLLGLSIVVPTMIFSGILHDSPTIHLLNPMVFLVAGLSLIGLVALGVLLSALTLKASGKEVLFPLLYFPLATPILLAAVQSSANFLDPNIQTAPWQWVGLLCSFDVVYFTLGLLLFGELAEST